MSTSKIKWLEWLASFVTAGFGTWLLYLAIKPRLNFWFMGQPAKDFPLYLVLSATAILIAILIAILTLLLMDSWLKHFKK